MKVLWVCNLMLPEVARQLNMEASNKEGWVSGLLHALLSPTFSAELQIQVSFPVPRDCCDGDAEICSGTVEIEGKPVEYFGFYEDVQHPEKYEDALEDRMKRILELANPDMVHCFGTEYPHTLAMCRSFPDKSKILVGIQGICALLAEAYDADLPKKVISCKTLRDILRRDSIAQQREKFRLRGIHETKAIQLAGNITGRTEWDRAHCLGLNPDAKYFSVNENLREMFYETQWQEADCEPHSIFLSQGDYPIKGLHYMLQAMPGILEKYPDATLSLAGSSLVACGTWKEKLKISGYGLYLRYLIRKYHLQDKIKFLGRMNGEEMLGQYLRSHLFVCCSSLENSSNSLGEAMLLGMPCVCADVGGLPTIFAAGRDGVMYVGHCKNNTCNPKNDALTEMEKVSKSLQDAVLEIWGDSEKMQMYCKNARNHAKQTHDKLINCSKMVEIYAKITSDVCL